MNHGDFGSLVRATFASAHEDKVLSLAAALSFAAVLSIAPLAIITIAIAAFALDPSGASASRHGQTENALVNEISRTLGHDTAVAVRGMIAAVYDRPHVGRIATILAWIAFAVGGSGFFSSLQECLNVVWHAEPGPRSHVQSLLVTIRQRLAALLMILASGAVVVGSLAVNTAVQFASTYLERLLPFPGFAELVLAANTALSLAAITVLLALVFKFLPNIAIAWRDVGFGAFATTVLFVVGQFALSIYLGKTGFASTYGAAGSLVVILLWVYYSAVVVLIGAEFTKTFARARGARDYERMAARRSSSARA